MQLGFDIPGKVRFAVFTKDFVCADCIEVFGVYKETVHVEETGLYGGET